MSIASELNGPFIAPRSGRARQLVVFLHGYGANGADLLSIGEDWAEALPDAAFIAPNAPAICDAFAAGFQWFAIRAVDRDLIEREQPMKAVIPVLDAYLDAQLAQWGVDESQMVVAGFSQGAMMAMYAMPRRRKACAGVIGYSGMLVDATGLKASGIQKMPILAIHGDSDTVVPPVCLDGVQQGFEAAGFDVETVMRPHLGHGIDQFGLMRGLDFARESLEKAA
jgi:phospholipase/carboxylesterase